MRRGAASIVAVAGVQLVLSACGSPNVAMPSATADLRPEDTWKSITWRQLEDADPRAHFATVARSPGGGYVAVGRPLPVDGGTRSPVWVSADGAEWQELGDDVLGEQGFVIGLHRLGEILVALTMTGEANNCHGVENPMCLEVGPPLRAWTSADGIEWTLRAEPLHLTGPAGPLLFVPRSAASSQRLLVTHRKGDQVSVAISNDGVAWQQLEPARVLVDGHLGSLVALGDRFVATGDVGEPGSDVPFVVWSVDGGLWRAPTALPALEGEVDVIAVGKSGMIARVVKSGTGLLEWWSSTDGAAWSAVADFAPLGHPQGLEGLPNGDLVGDGERMLAYDVVGHRAWVSEDGVQWQELAVNGDRPNVTIGGLRSSPIGLQHRDERGTWLAEPSSD